jgi:hypothetical protein
LTYPSLTKVALLSMLGLARVVTAQAAGGQSGAQAPPLSVEQSWDALLQGAIPQGTPDPALTLPQATTKQSPSGGFFNHFFMEGRTDYQRYGTDFSGLPTIAGIVNAPFTNTVNPNGYPYPQAFQPNANRIESIIDLGTRGWLSDRINTHFTGAYYQELTPVNPGAPAENILETFKPNRNVEFLTGYVEINGKASDGGFAGTSLQIGRQYFYGAEVAPFDGFTLSVDKRYVGFSAFFGRRFSYYSDPIQKRIGGGNFVIKLGTTASLEYQGLWYIRGSQVVSFRKRFVKGWMWNSRYRMYGSAPVEFSSQVIYSPGNGKTNLHFSFYQQLTNKDYIYDFTTAAREHDVNFNVLRLNLGQISPYSQFVVDGRRSLSRRFSLGGSVWVRHLNNSTDQGPYDTSFRDYRAHTQFVPLRKTEIFAEYHQRDSDRLSPLNPTSFDDISHSGETSVKDTTAEIRHTFGEGRLNLHGGAYYRRITMQDQFFSLNGIHQSGWLVGGTLKLDQKTKIFADYNLDNDFFLFMPDLKNSRALHVGVSWKF